MCYYFLRISSAYELLSDGIYISEGINNIHEDLRDVA